MKAVLIHAYSTTNSGDGLLVDEAAALVREAHPGIELSLVALDPASFDPNAFQAVIHPLTGTSESINSIQTLIRGAIAFGSAGRSLSALERVLAEADLVVAVGGGYLRTKNPLEALKMLLTHAIQLPRKPSRIPFIYLPQSIGPLNFGTKALVLSRLRNVSAVVVRDDRSLTELKKLGNVVRAPDMALLGLPSEWDPASVVAAHDRGPVGIVARELSSSTSRTKLYRERIVELHGHAQTELLAQATARGNDDPTFYRSLGFSGPFRTLRESVSGAVGLRPSAVISVRLHGSIQTIRSGVPSVHLSYERKGWGAYEDLGLSRFVHNAFDFDPDVVWAQVEELRLDPSEYWASVARSIGTLAGHRDALVSKLRTSIVEAES
jgi:polysaccharide pyruvyl transferase WcaK-like protein